MKITNVLTVKLTEVLRELQVIEWGALGLPTPPSGTAMNLPDGTDDIHRRLWTAMCRKDWGNQIFTNDSYFNWTFCMDEGPLEGDELILYTHCKDAMNTTTYGMEFLLFEVEW